MSSYAYTPGLKRAELCIIEKVRKLPVPGEVLVKVGEKVFPDTIIAKTTVPGKTTTLNVAYALGIEPDKIKKYLLKGLGDYVKKDDIIACYRPFFGLINKTCKAPCDGKIEYISEISGQIVIRELPIEVAINAFISGVVTQVIPNEGAIVQTPAAFVQGIFGVGGETYGELMMISDKPEDIVKPENISDDCKGKILVGGSLIEEKALRKALEVGARGIIVGGINDKDLRNFLGYEIGVAITGNEKIGLTLILTEGFGRMPMLRRVFALLKKFEGKLACINGATQVRAGVVRPEIIIPQEHVRIENQGDSGIYPTQMTLKIGTSVRIIREPYFGAIGKVVGLPIELQRIETESIVRVVEIELEDKRRIIIPRANIEIIEE